MESFARRNALLGNRMSYAKDVKEKRALLKRQNAELGGTELAVTCVCKKVVPIAHAYRCYFCRLWFCWTCAGYHFKERNLR